ncbi:MAG: EF-hand domain-containing protein [Prochlorococcaceae cyanobacterium]
MAVPIGLVHRYRRLFRFYDRNGDGRLTLAGDFSPAAEAIHQRWQGRRTPFPNLLELLLATYRHEQQRRDRDGDGSVDIEEFVASHAGVIEAQARLPQQALAFIDRAAGGFFDCLDLDSDGVLDVEDLEAYAAAYGHPTAGIAANLARMLAAFELPPGRLPRAIFLELVRQYWFDPSPAVPGRWLFNLEPPSP